MKPQEILRGHDIGDFCDLLVARALADVSTAQGAGDCAETRTGAGREPSPSGLGPAGGHRTIAKGEQR